MLKNINNKIIPFLDKIFIGKKKKYSLFFTALLDSIIAILPSDLITIYYFLREKEASILLQSIFIAFGSIVGGSVLYFLGDQILSFFPSILNSEYYSKIQGILLYSWILQFIFVVFFAFSSLVPFTWLSILLGIFNLNYFVIYLPAMFLGRFFRFGIISFLTKKYGIDVLNIVDKKSLWFFKLIIKLIKKIKLTMMYWYQKKGEVKNLRLRDLKQANIIAQIELFVTNKTHKFIELDKILFLHPINRKTALEKIQERIKKLREACSGNEKKLVKENLDEIIPSITDMKVVSYKDKFVIWEGNGRLMAINKVFKKDLKIELVEYVLDEAGKKIVEKLLDDLFCND